MNNIYNNMISEEKFIEVCKVITDVHSNDPTTVRYNDVNIASELLYSERMLQILGDFWGKTDYCLQLAAFCQHFERWKVARALFAMNKQGYYQWRKAVFEHQIKRTNEVLLNNGISELDIAEITEILSKKGNKLHVKAQIIEDVACLVFVIWYLQDFAAKHSIEKVKDIVGKTMQKMSDKGKQALGNYNLPQDVQNLLI